MTLINEGGTNSYQPHYILDRIGDLVPKKAKA